MFLGHDLATSSRLLKKWPIFNNSLAEIPGDLEFLKARRNVGCFANPKY